MNFLLMSMVSGLMVIQLAIMGAAVGNLYNGEHMNKSILFLILNGFLFLFNCYIILQENKSTSN